MSQETDMDFLFKVYDGLQDLMKQHELINATLKNLSICEEDQDFTPVEKASTAIIAACEKIENQLKPKKCRLGHGRTKAEINQLKTQKCRLLEPDSLHFGVFSKSPNYNAH